MNLLALNAVLGIALVGSPLFGAISVSAAETRSSDDQDKDKETDKGKKKDGAKGERTDGKEAKADSKQANGSGQAPQESPEAKRVSEKIRENPEQYMKLLDPENQNADQMLAKVPITRERLEKILKEEGIKLPGGLKVKTAGDPEGELAGTVFTGKDQPELKPEDRKDLEERLGKGKRLLIVSGEEKELSRSGPHGVLRSLGRVNSAAGSADAPVRVVGGSRETAQYAKYFRENPAEARELSKRVGIVDLGERPGQDAYRSAFRSLIPDSRKLGDRFAAKPLKTLGQQGSAGDGSTPRSTGKRDGSTPKGYERGRVAVGTLPDALPPTPKEEGKRAIYQNAGSKPQAGGSLRGSIDAAVRAVAPAGRKQAIARMVAEAAAKVGIPIHWALGIAKAENNFTERRAKDGGVGVMQVMPRTARDIMRRAGEKLNIYSTAGNIRAGVLYLKTMYDKYKGNLTLATAAYNGGPGGARRYARGNPHPITRRYVPRVLGYMKEALRGSGSSLLSGVGALSRVFDGAIGTGVAHAAPVGAMSRLPIGGASYGVPKTQAPAQPRTGPVVSGRAWTDLRDYKGKVVSTSASGLHYVRVGVAAAVAKASTLLGRPIVITSASKNGGGRTPVHVGHREGLTVDVRTRTPAEAAKAAWAMIKTGPVDRILYSNVRDAVNAARRMFGKQAARAVAANMRYAAGHGGHLDVKYRGQAMLGRFAQGLGSGADGLGGAFDGSGGSPSSDPVPVGRAMPSPRGPSSGAAVTPGDGSTPRSSPERGRGAPTRAEGAAAPVAGLGGLPVVSREGWGSQFRYTNGKAQFDRITVHHEAKYVSPNMTAEQEAAEVRSVERLHRGRQGWSGSYNYIIAPSGRIYELSGERQGVHSKHNNANNLGIAFMGNFQQQKPTQAALNSYAALAAYKSVQYGIPQSKLSWHGALRGAATECPGRNLIAKLPQTNELVKTEVEMLKELAKTEGFTPVLVKQPLPG